jgi:DNA-binding MarR family transcriptional regulator
MNSRSSAKAQSVTGADDRQRQLLQPEGQPDALHRQALELRLLVGVLAKLSGRDLERRLGADGTGLSGVQYGVMRNLGRESYTISELSTQMMLSPATLVPVVDALERKGLVVRGRDPSDRRRTPLSLTAQGRTLLADTPPISQADAVVHGLRGLGPERSQLLVSLLREMVTESTGSSDTVAFVATAVRPQKASGY